uniref:Uncharacterized protein n=1 Tax=Pipistrellus kuhlii TaxID=59472 RepID=A0A7J7TXK2_PIPKU|nr:hypothetical protein mPipKuh1_009214 [Pipistrellus kuhlii]
MWSAGCGPWVCERPVRMSLWSPGSHGLVRPLAPKGQGHVTPFSLCSPPSPCLPRGWCSTDALPCPQHPRSPRALSGARASEQPKCLFHVCGCQCHTLCIEQLLRLCLIQDKPAAPLAPQPPAPRQLDGKQTAQTGLQAAASSGVRVHVRKKHSFIRADKSQRAPLWTDG